MTRSSVPVDLFNPGQVFACLGLMELAEVLCGPVEAAFDWSEAGADRFVLCVPGGADPVAEALAFLAEADLYSIAPDDCGLNTSKWKIECRSSQPGRSFGVPLPLSPAPLPAVLSHGSHRVVIESWADGRRPGVLNSGRDNVKFWAGSGGYPGVALLRDALDCVRPQLTDAVKDPFALSAPQSSSFRFDWRRDYIPIDVGFSLNEHTWMDPLGYPLVEILAAIGLTNARPQRQLKLHYRYCVIGRGPAEVNQPDALLPPIFLRAALGASLLPFPCRTFSMRLGWPGQEGQARCITTVSEEATP